MAELKHSETDLRTSGQLLGTDQALLYIPTEALPADQNQRAALSAIQTYLAASFASTAQGALADSATQPGDNVSSLTNDAGYTNDQTGAEIKSAYEAEADTNAFTDAAQTKLGHITITQAVDLDAIETRVNALDAAVVLKGVWDASVGTFPGGGTAQAGESWIVSVGGTVGGVVFAVDDRLIAILDNASTGTYAANWHKADYSDLVQSVAGLTGSVSAAGLRTAINVEDGADVTDAANIAAAIVGVAGKTTPVDADTLGIIDSEASNALKELTGTNLKAYLKTYFDTLYGAGGILLQAKVVQYNPSAAQALTTTYADVAGSDYSFTPLSASSKIVYQYLNIAQRGDAVVSTYSHWKLMVDGVLEPEMNFTAYGMNDSIQNITGTIASWGVSAKIIKLQAREYSGAFAVKLFETFNMDGAGSSVLVRPTLMIQEFAT